MSSDTAAASPSGSCSLSEMIALSQPSSRLSGKREGSAPHQQPLGTLLWWGSLGCQGLTTQATCEKCRLLVLFVICLAKEPAWLWDAK